MGCTSSLTRQLAHCRDRDAFLLGSASRFVGLADLMLSGRAEQQTMRAKVIDLGECTGRVESMFINGSIPDFSKFWLPVLTGLRRLQCVAIVSLLPLRAER